MLTVRRRFWLCIPFLLIKYTYAVEDSHVVKDYASNPEWLNLAYYQALGSGYESDIDDPDFFLSENGKRSPLSELRSFYQLLSGGEKESKLAVFCKYPARANWVWKNILNNSEDLSIHCPDLIAWREHLNAKGISVIFPSAYLDSPSSMFGHTLLKINKEHSIDENSLNDISFSYAATKNPEDSELEFILRGLVGGYPGDISVLPYYVKLKEYNDIESRDIWEYQLNLDQAQTKLIVDHLWEIHRSKIDYFFFLQNCSYRVLAMLDILPSQTKLTEQFSYHAIPVDTIRALIDANLIKERRFRPSVITRLRWHLSHLSKEQKDTLLELVLSPVLSLSLLEKYSTTTQLTLLDIAYEYSRVTQYLTKEEAARKSLQLLSLRAKFEDSSALDSVPEPEVAPEDGHRSSRLSVSAGQLSQKQYIGLGFRPAYHDLLDPGNGYPLGAELKFLEVNARILEDSKIELNDLTLIGIKSLKARDRFFKSTSWEVSLGGHRECGSGRDTFCSSVLGGLGPSYALNSVLFSWMFKSELLISPELSDGYEIRGHSELSALYKSNRSQFRVLINKNQGLVKADRNILKASLAYQYNLAVNSGIYFKATSNRDRISSYRELEVGYKFYY